MSERPPGSLDEQADKYFLCSLCTCDDTWRDPNCPRGSLYEQDTPPGCDAAATVRAERQSTNIRALYKQKRAAIARRAEALAALDRLVSVTREAAEADALDIREAFEEMYLRADAPQDWVEPLCDQHEQALARLVAALVAATARAQQAERERDDWKRQWESACDDIALVQRERAAAREHREYFAAQCDRAEAAEDVAVAAAVKAEARAAELETALRTIENYLDHEQGAIIPRNALWVARHVLARDGNPGLGGAGGASSTGGKTDAGGIASDARSGGEPNGDV